MGHLTTNVFQADLPGSISAFKQRIVDDIGTIPIDMLQQFILNIQSTLQDASTAMEDIWEKLYSEKKKLFTYDGYSM